MAIATRSLPALLSETSDDKPMSDRVSKAGLWKVGSDDLGGDTPHVTLRIPLDSGCFDEHYLFVKGSGQKLRLWGWVDSEGTQKYELRRD